MFKTLEYQLMRDYDSSNKFLNLALKQKKSTTEKIKVLNGYMKELEFTLLWWLIPPKKNPMTWRLEMICEQI